MWRLQDCTLLRPLSSALYRAAQAHRPHAACPCQVCLYSFVLTANTRLICVYLLQIVSCCCSTRRQALCADQRALLLHLAVLENALQEVQACRRVLSYTYVLGYYLLDGTREKELYEYQQSLLETNTESLAELVQALSKDQTVQEASEELCHALK